MMTSRAFNVLITSLSGKVPLVRAVRRALDKLPAGGRVFGADINPDCVGRFFVDGFWEMPATDQLSSENVVRYCKKNKIRAIVPTRDGELQFFADHCRQLKDADISVMISSPEAVRACLDKERFFTTLCRQPGMRPIPTMDSPDRLASKRWVVKERFGSGSSNTIINVSAKEAAELMNRFDAPICQPYIEGTEYSVDLYIAQKNKPVGCVVRTRDVVVKGESQVTTTVEQLEIENLCVEAARVIGLTGHVLFQVIADRAGDMHIVECNCRFGGASSLSVAAGLDSFYWFFRECLGDDLSDQPYVRGTPGMRQIRHAEDRIVSLS